MWQDQETHLAKKSHDEVAWIIYHFQKGHDIGSIPHLDSEGD